MTDPSTPPLRGEAAWKAHRAALEKRNDAARKKGRAQRDAQDAELLSRHREAQRLADRDLPVQPEP